MTAIRTPDQALRSETRIKKVFQIASFSMIFVAIVTIFYLRILGPKYADPDTFWHLWAGRVIVESGSVPLEDPVCFTSAGLPWISPNWLSQVVMYRSFLRWGFMGPSMLSSWMVALAAVAHLITVANLRCSPIPSLVSLGFVLNALIFTHNVRPQEASFGLFAVCCLLLFREADPDRLRPTTALVLLAVLLLWNQLHGGVLFGYTLLTLDAIGSAMDTYRGRGRIVSRRAIILLIIVSVGMAGFAFHPHEYRALEHILLYKYRITPIFFDTVKELMPFMVRGTAGIFLELFVALLVGSLVAGRLFPPFRWLLPAVAFLHITLTSARGITFLILVAAPVLAVAATRAISRIAPTSPLSEQDPAPLKALAVALLLALGLWTFGIGLSGPPLSRPGELRSSLISPKTFPVGAAEFLNKAEYRGRIFNDYDAGGPLGWALYPQRRLFIDGRGDFHSWGDAYERYLAITNLEPGWLEKLDREDIELAALPSDSSLAAELLRHGWPSVYRDSSFTILAAPGVTSPQ
jgi:hypothetical protein